MIEKGKPRLQGYRLQNFRLQTKMVGVIALCSLLFTQFISNAQAEEIRYISDSLRVEMRSGPSNGFRIVNFLKSGTKLIFLQAHEDGDWIKIKTMKGSVGWVRKQHLTKNRASKDLLVDANNKINTIESDKAQQAETITQLQKSLNQIKAEQSTLSKKHSKLDKEYNTLKKVSNNAVQADKSNRELRKKNELYKIKVEELATDNERLKHDQYVDGITHGMFAVILGGILAVVLMQLGGRKRRTSGWD